MEKESHCISCVHFSPDSECGLDQRTGYCDVWEKFVRIDHTCERYERRGEGLSSLTVDDDDDFSDNDDESELELPRDIEDTLADNIHD